MEAQFGRAAVGAALSPLQEHSAEVSRDSGVESRSSSSGALSSEAPSLSPSLGALSGGAPSLSPSLGALSGGAPSLSPSLGALSGGAPSLSPSLGALSGGAPSLSRSLSGENVPQSRSSEALKSEDQTEEILRHTATIYSSYIRANVGEEILCLEKSLEEMLTRVDEFVGMLDMIRNDTSQIVNVSLPQIHQKSEDMRELYRKIDKLEAFVKMVAANVSAMEEQVTLAEGEVKTLPGAFKKIFRSVPGFLNKPASPKRRAQPHQEIPAVFRTDDYFTSHPEQ
ncbi:biogenesis of lysosome-related organelles complex 1 subunit 4 [Hoplias malabaricus]|uniref:biogenesis of lysosome-related organelles complex 1 subunit 4 n=1 Tax=Hoplias malabaricus TaxID=27720 RepID=UPI00346363B0